MRGGLLEYLENVVTLRNWDFMAFWRFLCLGPFHLSTAPIMALRDTLELDLSMSYA